MNDVLAVIDGGPRDALVLRAAESLAALVSGRVRPLRVDSALRSPATQSVLAALASDDVGLAVLPAAAAPAGLCWQVAHVADKPVVLVPPGMAARAGGIRRALLPLDGTPAAAAAVADEVAWLDRAGAEVIVLHVFDESTVPRFWDQTSHAYREWGDEFLSRCAIPHLSRLEVRTGAVEDQVLTAAAGQDVDLVALAWSRRLDPDRARTVHAAVARAPVPVLLVPVDARSGGSAATGRTSLGGAAHSRRA